MFLAIVTCGDVNSARPVLCIVPDKPDQFSSLVPVDSLIPTDCAYHRLSGHESLTVWKDEADGSVVMQPNVPSKLFITPDIHDRPGVAVAKLKVARNEQGYLVTYIQEGDPSSTWKEWNPIKRRGTGNVTGSVKQ